MESRKPVFRTAIAIVAIAAVAVVAFMSQGNEEHDAVKLADAPDMFSFIRPINAAPAASAEAAVQVAPEQVRPSARLQESTAEASTDIASVAASIEQEVRQLRSQGASDDEVYRLRAQRLSPDAAARLAHMEQEENRWQARIALYLEERARLLSLNANAHGTSQAETLQQLRNAFFSMEEQERLAASEPQLTPQLTMN